LLKNVNCPSQIKTQPWFVLFTFMFLILQVINRYFLRIRFDGTAYNGWQIQKNTPRTVQQVLNEKLSSALSETIDITGCGRTDTGVHAKEFFAHFDSEKRDLHSDPKIWLYKFNTMLPKDISILEILPVKPDAHARFSAIERSYEYLVAKRKDPFMVDRAYFVYGELDIKQMNSACDILLTNKDFSSFSKSNTQVKTNDCNLVSAYWNEEEDLLKFKISANRFLRNMVRAIVGTMIEVGKNKISLSDLKKIIEGKNRSEAGMSVPAGGLYLTSVKYPENIWLNG
jgi:tRNA pseudouridine38-40 synthase